MRWSQKAEDLLDLPDGALTGEAHIAVDGRRRVTIDGSAEILVYEDTVVRLTTLSGEVRIMGDALCLEHYRTDGVVVTGRVLTIEFL